MTEHNTRRKFLALTGASATTILGGCLNTFTSNDEEQPEGYPDPTIADATADVGNYRKTQEPSLTIAIIDNDGYQGPVRFVGKAKGSAAIYDETEWQRELREGQRHQAGYEMFTHEGAHEVEIRVEAVNKPENNDSLTITEEDDPEMIDYSGP